MITRVLAKTLAAFGVAILCSPAAQATTITVQNLGSILNDSISFPNTKTPGGGKAFEDFFEFTLPTAEYITASMSISGPVADQIPAGKGELILSTWTTWTSTLAGSPVGSLIEQAMVSAPSSGARRRLSARSRPSGTMRRQETTSLRSPGRAVRARLSSPSMGT